MNIWNVQELYLTVCVIFLRFISFSWNLITQGCHVITRIINYTINFLLIGVILQFWINKIFTFNWQFRIANNAEHNFVVFAPVVFYSCFALTRAIERAETIWTILKCIRQCRHTVPWSKFRASNQRILRNPWGHNKHLRIRITDPAIFIIKYFKVTLKRVIIFPF